MRKGYSYLRFSSVKQGSGDSTFRQLQWSEQYAKSHNLAIQDQPKFHDKGVSGFRGKNRTEGALGQFIAFAEAGTIPKGSVLLVESLDRLSRDLVGHQLRLFLRLLELGIEIVTREPAEHFTEASIGNPTQIIVAITIMLRAHEESAVKSMRVSHAWNSKREKLADRPLTAACPGWLRIKKDRTGFDLIPEKAAIIRRVFQMANEQGLGSIAICKAMNAESVPAIGSRKNSKSWIQSTVSRILRNRAVLGEFQPMQLQGRKRVAIGEPIKDYYPAVISPALFDKTIKAVKNRTWQRGPIGKNVANLFTGLLRDARDGSSMTLINKGERSIGSQLVSSAAQRGLKDAAPYLAVPYTDVETTVMLFLFNVDISELMPPRPEQAKLRENLDNHENKLAKIDSKIKQIQAALAGEGDFDSLLEVLKQLETNRKEEREIIETLKDELHSALDSHPVKDLQTFQKQFFESKDNERRELRLRVRSLLHRAIKEIWILPYQENGERRSHIQIYFSNGVVSQANTFTRNEGKRDTIGGEFVTMVKLFKETDLRDYRKLSKKRQLV